MGETIRIQEASGDTNAYLAPARATPGAPVLLLHPWWGLNQTIRDLADRLADDGFTVMAPDLFQGTVLVTADDAKAFLTSIGQGDTHDGALNQDRIMGSAEAALDHLLAHPDVRGDRAAIIGLSMGAGYGHEVAAGRPDVVAFVGFYLGIFEAPSGVAYQGHSPRTTSSTTRLRWPSWNRSSARAVRPTSTRARSIGSSNRTARSSTPMRPSSRTRTVAFLREQLG